MDLIQPVVLFLLTALTLFGFYGLLAWGLGLIFGQLGVVNVAHGDSVMVGAFTMFALPGVPFFLRLFPAVGIAAYWVASQNDSCCAHCIYAACWPRCWPCGRAL